MMFPHPFMMARIGQSIADLENDDLAREYQEHLNQVEQYARNMEERFDTLSEDFNRLASTSTRLVEYTESLEAERDALKGQVTELMERLLAMEAQAKVAAQAVQSVRENATQWMEENSKRLEGYEPMKKILRGLFENADAVFTDAITDEQRETISVLLDHLPD
jgi:predicted nuclease with TOPRIM domain